MGATAEETFGKNLSEVRRAHGVTQRALGLHMRAAGFKWLQTTAHKTERADRPIPLNEAVELCEYFGTTLPDMLGNDAEHLHNRMASVHVQRVLEMERELTQAAKIVAVALARLKAQGHILGNPAQRAPKMFSHD